MIKKLGTEEKVTVVQGIVYIHTVPKLSDNKNILKLSYK